MRQRGICKRALHHRLTVVKFSINRHRADVVFERRHQLALRQADFINWKKDDDLDAGNFMKRVGDRRARVAARRRQDGHLPVVLAQKTPEHPAHHLRGKILERRRRSLVQPHQENADMNDFQRHRKVVGLVAHRRQHVARNDALGEF